MATKKKKSKPTKKKIKIIRLPRGMAAALRDSSTSRKDYEKQRNKILKRIEKENKKAAKKTKPIKVKKSKPIIGHRKIRGQTTEYIYYDNYKKLKSKIKHARVIKKLPTREQAVSWWKGIGGGAGYFAIAREESKSGQSIFNIVETRTQRELSSKVKGDLGGVSRALQLIREDIEGFENEDY